MISILVTDFTIDSVFFLQNSGSYRTECVSGDWCGEVREVDLADLKQEPDDVCCVFVLYHFITTQRICTDRW